MSSGQGCLTVIIGGVDRSLEYQGKAKRHRRFRALMVSGFAVMLVATVGLAGIAIVRHVSAASPATPVSVAPGAPETEYFPSAYVNGATIAEPHIQAF